MIVRGYATIPAGHIHYRIRAGRGLPLVMLHQTASSGVMFEAMMRRLPEDWSLLALDTPGFGGSFDPALPPALDDYRDWAMAALDAIGVGDCHLLGHHTGGCIALAVAAHAVTRVRSLTVIGPVYLDPTERQAYQSKYAEAIAPDPQGGHLRRTWDVLGDLGSATDLVLRHREMIDYLRAWSSRRDAYRAVFSSDQPALYTQVSCPIQVLCAPDDVLFASYETMRTAHPGPTYRLLSGGNFEPDLDPDGCTDAVTAFLRIVERKLS